jgi:cell division protease FtsH
MLLILGVWLFFMRQMQGGSRGAMGFGKSKAKLLTEAHGRVTFEDVAGVDEAKQDLEEIVEFLRDPQKFQRLGGKIPRGVLLVGPPGTGKTLLARSVAGEANVPFFTISGSDFVEMFVGVGASRVRDMFEQAKKNAPCIIFIDEIDAVGRHRGAGLGGGNDEREQTLNQLLVEMDGFEANEGIILIAATNRPDVLDPALLRPGRFDRQVVVPNPDIVGRERILKVHVRNVPLAPNVDLKVLARGTPGFSGADLMNLVNEAALMAARRNKRVVTMAGIRRRQGQDHDGRRAPLVRHDRSRKEADRLSRAGHAITGAQRAVGRSAAQGDDHSARPCARHGHAAARRRPLFDELQVDGLAPRIMMGGRVAEELTFGKENITSGASSDIEQATKLARAMVTRWGFSDKLGQVPMARTRRRCSSATRWRALAGATALFAGGGPGPDHRQGRHDRSGSGGLAAEGRLQGRAHQGRRRRSADQQRRRRPDLQDLFLRLQRGQAVQGPAVLGRLRSEDPAGAGQGQRPGTARTAI